MFFSLFDKGFMTLFNALNEILARPTIVGVCTGLIQFLGPIWVAFLVGIIVGWVWKPKWACFEKEKLGSSMSKSFDLSSPSLPSRSDMSPLKPFGSAPCLYSMNLRSLNHEAWVMENDIHKRPASLSPLEFRDCSTSKLQEEKYNAINEEDLEHLYQLVKIKDGGPPWMHMMDCSTPNMSYQAWRRDPKDGPPQYRSRTVFEDATPKIVRDFFWDDEFRSNWDDMLAHYSIIEECPTTGTMVVQWIRKFPFFCKDREYIIVRRIWDAGKSYYCVTKGVPCPSVPRQEKPRRVDLYYSSWFIRAVESERGNGRLSACEVLLFHHEDMGIPWEIAKLGVRKGMWAAVKKIEPGLRAYQRARASAGVALSRSAILAQINTKINPEVLRCLRNEDQLSETELETKSEKREGGNISKLVIFGGAVVLACILDRGLLTKAVIFGVTRKFGNIGKRVQNP